MVARRGACSPAGGRPAAGGAPTHAAATSTPFRPAPPPPLRSGPGLKQGVTSRDLGSHVDLAATFVTLAGGDPPSLSDGQPAPLQPVAEAGARFFVPARAYEQ